MPLWDIRSITSTLTHGMFVFNFDDRFCCACSTAQCGLICIRFFGSATESTTAYWRFHFGRINGIENNMGTQTYVRPYNERLRQANLTNHNQVSYIVFKKFTWNQNAEGTKKHSAIIFQECRSQQYKNSSANCFLNISAPDFASAFSCGLLLCLLYLQNLLHNLLFFHQESSNDPSITNTKI